VYPTIRTIKTKHIKTEKSPTAFEEDQIPTITKGSLHSLVLFTVLYFFDGVRFC